MISGINLKIALKRLDISQAEAAIKIGKSRQTIVTWVGKSELDDETVELINKKLGIDLKSYTQGLIEKPTLKDIREIANENPRLSDESENQLREIIKKYELEIERLNHSLNDKLTIISLLTDKIKTLEKELTVKSPKQETDPDNDNRSVQTKLETK